MIVNRIENRIIRIDCRNVKNVKLLRKWMRVIIVSPATVIRTECSTIQIYKFVLICSI